MLRRFRCVQIFLKKGGLNVRIFRSVESLGMPHVDTNSSD